MHEMRGVKESSSSYSMKDILEQMGIVRGIVVTPALLEETTNSLPEHRYGLMVQVSPEFLARAEEQGGVAGHARVYDTPSGRQIVLFRLQAQALLALFLVDAADASFLEYVRACRERAVFPVLCASQQSSQVQLFEVQADMASINRLLEENATRRRPPLEYQLAELASAAVYTLEYEIRGLEGMPDAKLDKLSVVMPNESDDEFVALDKGGLH